MLVKIVTFGDLSDILGKEFTLELDEGETVSGLLKVLSVKTGSPEGQIGEFKVREEVGILLDGRGMDFLDGTSTVLWDGATIFLLLPFAGG